MKTNREIRKELKERDELGVSEEHTGHWCYDDVLKALLTGRQEILNRIENYIKNRYLEIDGCHIKKCKKCQTIRSELALLETRIVREI